MRDPKRIKPILKLIEQIWTSNPDLRLCQLIGNCFGSGDHYYVEDDRLETNLKECYLGEGASHTVKKKKFKKSKKTCTHPNERLTSGHNSTCHDCPDCGRYEWI